MRARRNIPALTIAVLAAAGMPDASAQNTQQSAFVAQGRAFAAKNCGRCHALGENDAILHPQAMPFRMVVERYPSESLAEALAEGIVSGHPDMPVFVLQPEEIEVFLAYLDSLGPKPTKKR